MSAISVTCRFLTLDNVLGIYIPVDIIILTATFTENSVMSFGCPLIAPPRRGGNALRSTS